MRKKYLCLIIGAATLLLGGSIALYYALVPDSEEEMEIYIDKTQLTSWTGEDEEGKDYSWICEGRWESSDQGDRYLISFNPNGHYSSYFVSPIWGEHYEFGRYEVKKNLIWMYASDDEAHPSTLIIEGRRLKDSSDGPYFRNIE